MSPETAATIKTADEPKAVCSSIVQADKPEHITTPPCTSAL